ncbi:hypothetical protein K439DRAFT_517164 [Ramaria rubella]|nr:hypothetical protein K439DRAFT_517164 [Ramaria rubella]
MSSISGSRDPSISTHMRACVRKYPVPTPPSLDALLIESWLPISIISPTLSSLARQHPSTHPPITTLPHAHRIDLPLSLPDNIHTQRDTPQLQTPRQLQSSSHPGAGPNCHTPHIPQQGVCNVTNSATDRPTATPPHIAIPISQSNKSNIAQTSTLPCDPTAWRLSTRNALHNGTRPIENGCHPGF